MRPHLGLAMGFVSLAATAADRTRRIARRGQLRILEFRRPAHDHRRGLFDEAQPLAGRNRRQRRHGARLVQGPAADRDEDRPDPGLSQRPAQRRPRADRGPVRPWGEPRAGGTVRDRVRVRRPHLPQRQRNPGPGPSHVRSGRRREPERRRRPGRHRRVHDQHPAGLRRQRRDRRAGGLYPQQPGADRLGRDRKRHPDRSPRRERFSTAERVRTGSTANPAWTT